MVSDAFPTDWEFDRWLYKNRNESGQHICTILQRFDFDPDAEQYYWAVVRSRILRKRYRHRLIHLSAHFSIAEHQVCEIREYSYQDNELLDHIDQTGNWNNLAALTGGPAEQQTPWEYNGISHFCVPGLAMVASLTVW